MKVLMPMGRDLRRGTRRGKGRIRDEPRHWNEESMDVLFAADTASTMRINRSL